MKSILLLKVRFVQGDLFCQEGPEMRKQIFHLCQSQRICTVSLNSELDHSRVTMSQFPDSAYDRYISNGFSGDNTALWMSIVIKEFNFY